MNNLFKQTLPLILIMLTYEIILKHLMPVANCFSLKSQLTMPVSDFKYFNKLFDDSFYRYGVITTNNNINVSLKNSISFCLNIQTNDDIPNNIKEIVNELDINIIIFDFKNNIITSQYNGDFFNPWKPTIYLANYDDWWEPIVSKDCKLFSFSSSKSSILKNNILIQNINKYETNEPISINDNFHEIIMLEGISKEVDECFMTNEKPPKSKLDKMKKAELIELCNTMNKIINIKKPTKKDLIDLIYLD